jgi:cobalt-precorrin 5A hydrolase
MKMAAIGLCNEGARVVARLMSRLASCDAFVHQCVTELPEAKRFDRVVELTGEIFASYGGLIYVMPTGVVVRAIAPCLGRKTVDPAVVAVDVGGRWAISLLGGHEGGANALALTVANLLGAEPIVTTTTEAAKNLIVGVGCRRGVARETVVAAIREALAMAGASPGRVRWLASVDFKGDEAGLIAAAGELALPLRLISADEIRQTPLVFAHSSFVREQVDLPAVAEPAALLAGRRTRLLLPRQVIHGVTVAIAQEDCSSLG